jgi:hypothetical protein
MRRCHTGAAVLDVLAWFPSARSINTFPVAAEKILSPGATMSGFILPSPVEPFEKKYDDAQYNKAAWLRQAPFSEC